MRRDALQAISVEVRAVMNCADISLVSSERLPVDTALPDMSIPGDVRPIAFERWTVTACSRKLTFLMAYWPSEAGTMLWRQSRES